MKRIVLLLFPALLFGCNSPDAWDLFKSTGRTVTVTRPLSDFNKIDIEENVALQVYVQDTASKIVISAGKNILPEIKSYVKNGTLTVVNKNKYDFVRSNSRVISVDVYIKQLSMLKVATGEHVYLKKDKLSDTLLLSFPQCSGDISATVNVKMLIVSMNESTSKLEIVGTADTLTLDSGMSYGPILLSSLQSKVGTVSHSGSNNLYLNVSNLLNVTISGHGNVYYKGNPVINSRVLGKGKLIGN